MAGLPPVGVQAIVQGVTEYVSNIKQMTTVTNDFTKNTTGNASGGGSAFAGIGAAAGGIGVAGLLAMAAAAAVAWKAINAVIDAVTNGIKALVDFGKESVQAAARVNELTLAAVFLGMKGGSTQVEIEGMIKKMQEMGVTNDAAALTIAQLARYNLNLAQSTELVKIAQDAAILTGKSASETLDDITRAIVDNMPRALKSAGLPIDAAAAEEIYAKSLGKTKEALTEDESAQARLNAVIEKGAAIAGLNELAQANAGKQMRSLNRDVDELKDSAGQPFQAAFLNWAMTLRMIAQGLTKAIEPGGALYPIMIALGAAASFLTEGLKNLVSVAIETGTAFVNGLAGPMGTAAQDAFTWGGNIIINLATGIVDAASSVLTWAMNVVSNMLSFWLAPGSPPKVAPKIDKWGADAMTQYLKGFTEADFSVLNSIEGAFSGAINALVGLGQIKDQQAGNKIIASQMLNLAALQQQFKETGKINEQMLSKIAAKTGKFTEQLKTYIRDELMLTAALDAQAAAEKRLDDAKKAFATSDQKVNALTREYNAMLRSGASKEALKAKLAEINAAEKARDLAADNITTSETDLEAAKAKTEEMQKAAKLQEQLIQQLTKLAQAQAKTKEAKPPSAGAGAGGLALPKAPKDTKGIGGIDVIGEIGRAVENAKRLIGQKLSGLWDNLTFSIQAALIPAVDRISLVWAGLAPKLETTWKWIKGQAKFFTDAISQFWKDHGDSIMAVWDFIKSIIAVRLGEMITQFETWWPRVVEVWNNLWTLIKAFLFVKWEEMKIQFQQGLDFIGTAFDTFAAILKFDWGKFWTDLGIAIGNKIREIIGKAQEIWDGITKAVETFAKGLRTKWETFWNGLLGFVKGLATDFYNVGVNIVQSIIDGYNSIINRLKKLVEGLGAMLPEWLRKLLGMSSPSKVFQEIGRNMIEGLGVGVKNEMKNLNATMKNTAIQVQAEYQSAVANSPTMAMAGASSGVSVNFGTVNINNGMDLGIFAAQVRNVIVRELH